MTAVPLSISMRVRQQCGGSVTERPHDPTVTSKLALNAAVEHGGVIAVADRAELIAGDA